ncbi:MAG: hypothetical protein PHV15_15310, partial [Thomasclavelia ramosa]|nr:hypothetical protein [Thomasclavelia ramosa]
MSNFLETITQKIVDYCKVTKNYCTMQDMEQYVDSYLPGFRETVIQEYLDNLELNKKFRMEIEIQDGEQYQLWGVDDPRYNYNGTIDWGDGTIETFSTATPTHIYNLPNTTGRVKVELKISGQFDALYNSEIGNNYVGRVLRILSWGDGIEFEGFKNLDHGFYSASKLTYIAGNYYGGSNYVKDFSYCFYGCISLREISTEIFKNCDVATSYYSCFEDCVASNDSGGLMLITVDLFKNRTSATNFSRCFYGCRLLGHIGDLFDGCSSASIFSYCFGNCDSLMTIPTNLFNGCGSATNFDGCFYSCHKLNSIPFSLFSSCPGVQEFGSCFSNCISLTSIPEI